MNQTILWIIVLIALWLFLSRHSLVLFQAIIRFAGFCVCLWITLRFQRVACSVLMEYGLADHPALAELIALFGLLSISTALLRRVTVRLGSPASDAQVIGLDVVGVGVVVSMAAAFLVMVLGICLGVAVQFSWLLIVCFAFLATLLDILFPSFLAGSVRSDRPVE